MICVPCRERHHEDCTDHSRLTAARKGKVPGMTDPMASRWCDCSHFVLAESTEHCADRVDC